MRPITVNSADRVAFFKPVPDIGEERFPAYLAVPLLRGTRLIGVCVYQRRQPFGDSEVTLATALAGAFSMAVDRGTRADRGRADSQPPNHRSVRLPGTPTAPGVVLGSALTLPTFEGLRRRREPPEAGVEDAIDGLVRELRRAQRKVGTDHVEAATTEQRFRKAVRDKTRELGVVEGLRAVAMLYASAAERPANVADASLLAGRAHVLSDLCLLTAASLTGALPPFSRRILLLPDAPSELLALFAVGRRVGGVAVAGPFGAEHPSRAILRAGRVPLVSDVAELFMWALPSDRVIVDGTEGWIRVEPTPGEVARLRRRLRASEPV